MAKKRKATREEARRIFEAYNKAREREEAAKPSDWNARLLARIREKNPAKFDRCVREVKKSGSAVNAYAVCTAAGTRRRGKNPVRVRDPEHKALVSSVRKHFSHDEALLKQMQDYQRKRWNGPKRTRRKNPGAPKFELRASRGGSMLKYDGQKFTSRGKAMRFHSLKVASALGRHLMRKYPSALRGYRLSVWGHK